MDETNNNNKNVLKPHVLYEDGSIYLGEFSGNEEKRNGVGILLCEDKSKYKGQWSEDKPNGKGQYIYPNGDYYFG